MAKIPVTLTIAGSDSGGGAGIQADLKTFAALGAHGTVALTAITAQNTEGVYAIQDVELKIIEKQLDVVIDDIGVDAAKTGMLHRKEVIKLVAEKVRVHNLPLVVDPVMVSKSGSRLLMKEAEDALKELLLPVATVVTPNAVEAEVLSGIRVRNVKDMEKVAKVIAKFGPKAVVVKGGHVDTGNQVVDLLYTDEEFTRFIGKKINTKNTHGTGCVFSAAITVELARRKSVKEAVKTAKEFIGRAVEYGLPLGKGHGPVNPTAWMQIPAEKYHVIDNLSRAVELIEANHEVANLIPEVQSNIAMALPKLYLGGVGDVAAIPGRIIKLKNRPQASEAPAFGASSHLARILLTVMEEDPRKRGLMNIKYSEEVIETCKKLGYTISSFDRKEEPKELKEREGGTLPWGIRLAIKKVGFVPDIIYDLGDVGKEPMVRVFGEDAVDVAHKVVKIANAIVR
ncbi:MAG: bifunctional hydroxymethylpyrimidine kinase/phosphomethylpyrimidine kinase [Nitrososphaeria archaeon]